MGGRKKMKVRYFEGEEEGRKVAMASGTVLNMLSSAVVVSRKWLRTTGFDGVSFGALGERGEVSEREDEDGDFRLRQRKKNRTGWKESR